MKIFTGSLTLALLLLAPVGEAQESFYRMRLDEVELTSGSLPAYTTQLPGDARQEYGFLLPYVALEGEGDAFVHHEGHSVGTPWHQPTSLSAAFLCVRKPDGSEIRGRLFVPKADWKGMVALEFRIPADKASADAEPAFRLAEAWHFDQLFERGAAGGAWFRRERRALSEGESGVPPRTTTVTSPAENSVASYSLFSGGRAVSENLQLDRALPETAPGDDVALEDLAGIGTPAYDWDTLLSEETPAFDPLASLVPADQHAVFFPSFTDMVRVAEEADVHGAPLVEAFEGNSNDARTRARYERQLCLALDGAARTLGPLVISSLVITGSDPYLRTGSDLAVILEPRETGALAAFLDARQEQALELDLEGLQRVEGDILGVPYRGVVSDNRAVSSYLATVGDALVVTNSLHQLTRVIEAANTVEESLIAAPEYRFFRQRYPRGEEETAFLLLPDAAIRRWCSPKWRLGAARRVHAAAFLADLQAKHGKAFLEDNPPGMLKAPEGGPELGELAWKDSGVHSSVYGDLAFQTPIAELSFERVSTEEARLYGLWRDGYERNWSGFFDPIAAQLFVEDERLGFDLTVMPLIDGTDYREFASIAGKARLDPQAGDRHDGTLVHFVLALDTEGEFLSGINDNVSSFLSDAGVDLFDWLGNSVAIYVEDSPIWAELADAEDREQALEDLWTDFESLPLAIHVDVKSPLKLAAFLVALRSLADQTAPGAAAWEAVSHGEHRYVRIGSDMVTDDFAIYYATPPGAFVLSLSETTIQGALARLSPTSEEQDEETTVEPRSHWLGESVALEVAGPALDLFARLGGENTRRPLRHASWNNIAILNEWKRLYPKRNPVDVHEELWHERLTCPGGGTYVWNETWHTMESTVYGHPGDRRDGAWLPEPYASIELARFGLTLGDNNLRARVEFER